MPNLVEIEVKSDDLVDFSSVFRKVAALKAELRTLSLFDPSGSNIDSYLSQIKSKLQAHRIADLLDLNMNPGVIDAQLMFIKRRIQSHGITDLLDFNVDTSKVDTQLRSLQADTVSIPVSFDVSKFPTLGPSQNISDKFSILGLQTAEQQLAVLNALLDETRTAADAAGGERGGGGGGLAGLGLAAFGAGGWFNFLRGKTALFGGALTSLGVPSIIAAASGLHILIDGLIETAAVIVPAGVALAAFGIAAADTFGDVGTEMQHVFSVSTALTQSIYPMTGAFGKLIDAVKPEVFTLFGEALVVAGHDTSFLTQLAVNAGHVLDQLGARAAAALMSGGLGSFLSQGPHDLAVIGDIISNIFGTVGNLLKVLPGYASILLNTLDAVTKGLESFTGSGFGQWASGVFLAFHGFILWGGLAATAAVALGNGLVGLAAKFGLAETGALAFDAAQFGTGIKLFASYALDAGAALVTFSGAEDLATASTGMLEAALIVLDAVNPLVWVGLAAAALGGLVFALTRAHSATSSYDDAVKQALQSVPVSQFGITLTNEMAQTTELLAGAQQKLASTQEFASVMNLHTGATSQQVTSAYQRQIGVVQGYRGELSTLHGFQENYNTLLKAAGGNLSFLSQAGITNNDVMNASKSTLAQYKIELQGLVDSQKALGLGTGRAAAALNAEGDIFARSGKFIVDTLPNLQQMTQAEDNLLNVILAGPQAFIGFEQSVQQMGKDAKASGASLDGLNASSLTLARDFYSNSVPAAQKMIDALQQQGTSTGSLSKVIATEAGQMLNFAGTNKEARSVIVDLINNALGPGTVSLEHLNTWVGNNSTSLRGMNSIVAASTIKAGDLTNTLAGLTKQMFDQDLLLSAHVTPDTRAWTNAIVQNGAQSDQARSARQRLITDLENAGFSAKTARQYVQNLQNQIDAMHGKDVGVGVHGSGSGNISAVSSGLRAKERAMLHFAASGMLVPGSGTRDTTLIAATPGEAVVPTNLVPAVAPILAAGGVPGFGSGGVVGGLRAAVPWMAGTESKFAKASELAWAHSAMSQFRSAARAQARAQSIMRGHFGGGIATPGLISFAEYLMAHGATPTGAAGAAGAVAGESGGNPEILQAGGGGGTGLLQWTPGSSAFPIQPIVTGNVGRDMAVQLIDALAYINSRGGIGALNAAGASGGLFGAAMEMSRMEAPAVLGSDIQMSAADAVYNAIRGHPGAGAGNPKTRTLDHGAWLPPGNSAFIAHNATGAPEHLVPAGSKPFVLELRAGSNSDLERAIIAIIRKAVQEQGGGSAQVALGQRY